MTERLADQRVSGLQSTQTQVRDNVLMVDTRKVSQLNHLAPIDSASSAVRNLNDHEIMGRKLRVDFSNEGGAGGNDDTGNRNSDRNNDRNDANSYNPPPTNGTTDAASIGGPLPPLPPGRELPAGVTCTDAISRTLNTLPPAQLLDILSSMKQLATTDPARATELLNQAPQLSYAIFQALLLMGLVGPEAINSVLEPGSVPTAAPPAMPAGYPPAPGGGFPVAANTPPVAAPGPYAPPPVAVPTPVPAAAPAPAPAAAFGAPGQNPDELIQQVLSLPEEVIAQLPEAEKAAILQLRAQYGGQRV